MAYFELIGCRIKIQICVGHFPDGRMRTRTFGIGNVRPDVTADDAAAVARAIAPLLAHPVVQVRLVRKYLLVRGEEAIPDGDIVVEFDGGLLENGGDTCYAAGVKHLPERIVCESEFMTDARPAFFDCLTELDLHAAPPNIP